jgi:hypothetical protein
MAGWFRREVTDRSPDRHSPATSSLHRRLRVARRRALRWFTAPIAITERARRDHEVAPSLWAYGVLGRMLPTDRTRPVRHVRLIRAGT